MKKYPSAHQAQSPPQKKRKSNILSSVGFCTYCLFMLSLKFALLCCWGQLRCCALLGGAFSRVTLGVDASLWRVADRDNQRLSPGLCTLRDRLFKAVAIRRELHDHPVMRWLGGCMLVAVFVGICVAVL